MFSNRETVAILIAENRISKRYRKGGVDEILNILNKKMSKDRKSHRCLLNREIWKNREKPNCTSYKKQKGR